MKEQNTLYERYQRQMILKGFGPEGQEKLQKSSVLVVGAGGLGCPALQYLVAAGVGSIGIVDNDVVSLHNLHRQVLFTTTDIGREKAEVAAQRLTQMNPDISIAAFPVRLTNQNALDIIGDFNLVLDATDNFATRYIINDACVLLNKPLVYGAISQFEGQVAVFNAGKGSVNYRDLFPQSPEPGSVLNCAEAGVLGVLPGIIGTMQATEVIKLLTGMGKPLVNQLFTYNALTNDSYVFELFPKEETSRLLPTTETEFQKMDYEWLCEAPAVEEIDRIAFNELLHRTNAAAIDVRKENELPEITEFNHQKIPLSLLKENLSSITADTVIFFCQSGKRSLQAAKLLSATFGQRKKVYSLKGGILQWKKEQDGKEA
ncbi:molybdopterin-synthase adenylyltransferase MoeB [Flavisolibacter sp. BT320]|nr:molybdopterin-synthase adenylyltransferase MoeB [Flavisolibacter longurius]